MMFIYGGLWLVDLSPAIATLVSSPKIIMYSIICTTPLFKNRDFLTQKYTVEGLSARQIAREIDSSHDAVNRALKEFGIKKREVKTGPMPYGWKVVKGKRVPHVRQQNVIKRIVRMREQGMSLKKIAAHLNLKEIAPPAKGRQWHSSTVGRIIHLALSS